MENFFRESGVLWLWEKIKTLLSAKQDKLVSGTNIKTINGTSLLGEGDVTISGGGGNFNESGTYPNLTAGKASKLATARTIALSGGARGETSFDGSKDVDIPVTSINEGKMVWNDTYEKNKVSILDTLFSDSFGNKLAYLNPTAIKVEYSRDGGATWLDYGNSINGTSESINKTRLVTHQCGLGNYYQGKRTTNTEETYTDQLRITIDAIDGDVYFSIKKILIYTSTFIDADNKQVKIETQSYSSSSVDTGLWKTRGTYHIVGQPGWSAIPTTGWPNFGNASSGHIRKVRFTFYQNASSKYRGHVDNIAFLAERVTTGGNTLTKTGHLYTMDESQNATFPAAVTATKHVTTGGNANQVVLGNGGLKPISELSPITDADAEILLDNHIHSIDVNANGNDVNINVIKSSKNGNTWETEDNDITIPLATTTSAGVMSKEDKAKLDGNISIEPDSGMPDFIGDFEYSDVDYEAIIDLTTVDWINWVEGGLFVMNAEETWEEDNGDTSYHQCVVTFIYRANGCIPISIVNTNKMTAKMSGMVITINLTEGTGELRFKQIKLI